MPRHKSKFVYRPLKTPNNAEFLKRGLFAYGKFKKGQIAYSRIEDCVDRDPEDDEINREMLLRDGVPLITNKGSPKITKGHKIHFIEGKEKEAYETISKTIPEALYKWSIIKIVDDDYNVLIGVNPGFGSSPHCDEDDKYMDNFDGNNDPYFSELIPFIRSELNVLKDDGNRMFKLQMYYMILWSAIDRYCRLKYNVSKNQGDYLTALSEDSIFQNAFDSTPTRRKHTIFSATNIFGFKFNAKDPKDKYKFVINYYYTIRSNVVHRGKDKKVKEIELEISLNELLEIFEKMIKETFKEEE